LSRPFWQREKHGGHEAAKRQPGGHTCSKDLRAHERRRLARQSDLIAAYTGDSIMTHPSRRRTASASGRPIALALMLAAMLAWGTADALAHNVTPGDAGYIQEIWGVHIIPFIYLGAKHMVTGYDHILFLLGVVFFLYKMKDVAIYVSLFAAGHSVTMLLGVWYGWGINAYIIDAIIGLSVVYKALDNLGAFRVWFGVQPDTKAATLLFGFCHGLDSTINLHVSLHHIIVVIVITIRI
jgi:low affinity Fe/Cu permease